MAIIDGLLLLADPYSISCYSLSNPERPTKVSVIGLSEIQRLGSPPGLVRPRTLLAQDRRGRTHLLDLSQPNEPVILAVYSCPPWFAHYHRLGNLMVNAAPDSKVVEVYVAIHSDYQTFAADTKKDLAAATYLAQHS